jgi:hypothetical protein
MISGCDHDGGKPALAWCAADPGPTSLVPIWVPALRSSATGTMLRIAGRALHRVRDTRAMCSRRGPLICPSVESPLQKYFAFAVGQIISTDSRHPVPQEGRWPSSQTLGWDAVDAAAFCARRDRRAGYPRERSTASGREMLLRTAKSCGPDASTPASSPAEAKSAQPGADQPYPRDDGDKKARSPRARRKPLKPLRAGTSGDSGVLVVTRVRSITTIAHEAAGALGTRRSPRPLWAED